MLAGAGLDLTAAELADALWLALRSAPEEPEPGPADAAESPERPPHRVRPPDPPGEQPATGESVPPAPPPVPPQRRAPDPVPRPGPGPEPLPVRPPVRRPVYALTAVRDGRGAAPVRVPGVPGLPNPLSVTRALRPLKRRVSSLHRFELDEVATAEASADGNGLGVVLRPERARWLDLVLAVDDGLSLRLWQDTIAELGRVLATSGIFRTVRRCAFDARDAMDAAVVDGNRTVVLAVTDGVGAAWQDGSARRTLARWARKAPTAVLQPLPLRLWPGTALPAQRMRVRSSGPAPANHLLDAYDPWLPARLAPRVELPVPVLELGDWSLAPWAGLMASQGGTATLRVIDAAAPPGGGSSFSGPAPRTPEERLSAFQETVSPEAYELAGHLAAVDPLTLPVMRVVQSAALPGSSPSCLSEVLLSGLMRAERPLGDFDVFAFDPDVRSLLRMVILGSEAQRTVDAVSDFIAPRLGRLHDFPALIADRSGTLDLPVGGEPFAELPPRGAPDARPEPPRPETPAHPAAEYVVGVRRALLHGDDFAYGDLRSGDLRCGYLLGDRLVLAMGSSPDVGTPYQVLVHDAFRTGDGWLTAETVWANGHASLLRVTDPRWRDQAIPAVPRGSVAPGTQAFPATAAYFEDVPSGSEHAARLHATVVDIPPRPPRGRLPDRPRIGPAGPDASPLGAAVFQEGELVGIVVPPGRADNTAGAPSEVLLVSEFPPSAGFLEIIARAEGGPPAGAPDGGAAEEERGVAGAGAFWEGDFGGGDSGAGEGARTVPPRPGPPDTRTASGGRGAVVPEAEGEVGTAGPGEPRAGTPTASSGRGPVLPEAGDGRDAGALPVRPHRAVPEARTRGTWGAGLDDVIAEAPSRLEPWEARVRARLERELAGGPRPVVVFTGQGDGPERIVRAYVARRHSQYRPVLWVTADSPDALDRRLAEFQETGSRRRRLAAARRYLRSHEGWLIVVAGPYARPDHTALRTLLGYRTGQVLVATSEAADSWPPDVLVLSADPGRPGDASTGPAGIPLPDETSVLPALDVVPEAARARQAEATSLDHQGLALAGQRRFDEAITAHERAAAIFGDIGDLRGAAGAETNLGLALAEVWRLDDAVTAHRAARKSFQRLGDRRGEARALDNLGIVLRQVWRFEDAVAAHTEALEIFREIGHRAGEARALDGLALDLRQLGRTEEGIAAHTEAAEIFRAVGDDHGEGWATNGLGSALAEAGRFGEAERVHNAAAEIFRVGGDRRGEGWALDYLGLDLRQTGRYPQSIVAHREAVAAFQDVGDRRSEGLALVNLGLAYGAAGRFLEADEEYGRAIALFEEVGDRHSEGMTIGNRGVALRRLGRMGQAVEAHEQSARIFAAAGDRHGEGWALDHLGLDLREWGRFARAADAHERAAEVFAAAGDRQSEAAALGNLGLALSDAGRYARAADEHARAAAAFHDTGDRHGEGRATDDRALALAEDGRLAEAAELHTRAARIFGEIQDRRNQGIALRSRGLALVRLGRKREAVEAFDEAITLFRRVGDSELTVLTQWDQRAAWS
ncbi:SAV_2336 N-terminal domain-related protein [Streptomyces sp.]|uniref:SAV_2336 N-terminal domain-related protein n=1 Tax=Streptomyces sp. TaxID=1931 RepID=UPI002F407D48